MAEERITETVDPAGNVTERTIERGPDHTTTVVDSRGGGGGALVAILVLVALVIGAFFLFNMNKSETRKDDAVATAATKAGDAAKDVGDSAKKAADDLAH